MTTITEQLGRVLADRYRLDAGLGSGTSAHVYAAFDTRLGRRVAIKLVHPGLVSDEGFLKRLRAEARSVAALNHPNVLKVYDWGEEEDGPFLVLEYLGGGSLRAMLDTGVRLDPVQAATIGLEAARGLSYAHRRGFVHRDIKPANLLFDDEGGLRIADFGLARALAEAAWTEPAGAMLGTARYASPEQAEGRPLDDRSDVYSLALVLYEAMVGRVPFAADTTLATLMARVGAQLPIVAELGPLAPILALATIGDPVARLDATELAANLEMLVRQLPPPAPLALAHEHAEATTRRREPVTPAAAPPDGELTALVDAVRTDEAEEAAAQARYLDEAVAVSLARRPGPVDGDAAAVDARAADGPLRDAPVAGVVAGTVPIDEVDPDERRRPPRARRAARPRGRHRLRTALLVFVLLALVAGGVTFVALRFVVYAHTVPRLTGLEIAAARAAADAEGLKLEVAAVHPYSASATAGVVLAETPKAGSRLRSGSHVIVELSAGRAPVAVPALVGKSRAVGLALLASDHLVARVSTTFSETVANGTVISSTPDGGSARYGSAVAVVISKGPAPRTIPAGLDGASWPAARSSIEALRLVPIETLAYSTTVASGVVISTAPASGTTGIVVGSTVTVVVSKGPQLVAVPSVQGDSITAALAALKAAGLDVTEQIGPPDATYATTTVPATGTEVAPGTQVTLYAG